MAIIHPCRHCPKRPTCPLRAEAAAAMASGPMRVTVARVSCTIYEGLFTAGDRVTASIGGAYASQRWGVHGTVTGPSGRCRGKWVIQVDGDCVDQTGFDGEDATDRHPFISVFPDRLTKLDEPTRAFCPICGNAKAADGTHLDPKGNGECDGFRTTGWGE